VRRKSTLDEGANVREPIVSYVSLKHFAISSIGIREEKKRVAARGSQSFPLIFPSSFLSRSPSRNYDRIPLGERDAKRTDNIRQETKERGRKGRRRVHGSARKRWGRWKEERVRFWSGKSRSTRSRSFTRGLHNRKLSMSLGSRKERFALATWRFPSNGFSRSFTPGTSTIKRRTLSFATLQGAENLTNGFLPACETRDHVNPIFSIKRPHATLGKSFEGNEI